MMASAEKDAKCLVSWVVFLFVHSLPLFCTFRTHLFDRIRKRFLIADLNNFFSLPDENECKYRPCDVFAHCTNTMGSFYCSCFPGYEGDGFECHGKFSNLQIFLQMLKFIYFFIYDIFLNVTMESWQCFYLSYFNKFNQISHNMPLLITVLFMIVIYFF